MSPIPAKLSVPVRAKADLSPDEAQLKRELYERLKPHRRKFIDRLGYEVWDPFQAPNEPLDMRTDASKRTTQELIRSFYHALGDAEVSNDFRKGALDTALGIVNKDEQTLGAFAFCLWYHELMTKEGLVHED